MIPPTVRERIRRSGGGRGIQFALLALVVVIALVAVGVLAIRMRADAAANRAQGSSYTPPALGSGSPVPSSTANRLPLIEVIGDETTSGPSGASPALLWPRLVRGALKANVSTYADAGAGYVTEADDGSGTFVATAKSIDPASKVVVFLGGANGSGAPTLSVVRDASQAFANAKSAAPNAELVVVGPIWRSSTPPGSIAAVRDAVRSAASVAGARFVDPIAAGWFTSARGAFAADQVTLTAAGQAVVAARMRPIIRSAIG